LNPSTRVTARPPTNVSSRHHLPLCSALTGSHRSTKTSKRHRFPMTALCAFLLSTSVLAVSPVWARAAGTATSTALTITTGAVNNGVTVTSISKGTAVNLTATVTGGAGVVLAGRVNFCDAAAAHCTDAHLVGVAYLTKSGTASFTFVPSPGVHSYKAEYAGTSGLTGSTLTSATVYAASSSAAYSLTVVGAPTTATLSQSGTAGAYTLKATVAGTGSATGPTGKVSFVDTSNSNAVLGTATLGSAAPTLSWSTSLSPATAAQSNSIAVADFNGDGIPDLAIATNGIAGGNGSVQTLLGNGDGTFQAAKTYAGLPGIQLIVAAPFITGGPEDLLIVNNANTGSSQYEDNGLLLTGDGKGNFTAGNPFVGCLNSVSAIVVGDFNGDGIPDFAVGGILNGSANLAITYGDGTGTFPTLSTGCSADTIYAIFGGPAIAALGVGDFQGNGGQDIAAVQFDGAVDVFLSTPGSAYPVPEGPQPIIPTASSSPTAMAVGDFNGDGYADLAITNGGQNNLTILLGDATGTNFTAAASPSTGSTPAAIAVADFNGDGINDLAVANSGDGTITILLGKGDGTFTPQPVLTAGSTPVALAVGKFNDGGVADIAVVNQVPGSAASGTATVLLSQLTQTATATATNISPTGTGTTHLVNASYAGDSVFTSSVSSTTSLNGSGGTETLTVAPATLTFSAQAGSTSAAQTVTLTNTGTAVVNISSVSAAGGYTASSACGSTLAVGANCLISVEFAPTVTGSVIGSLTISDNATGSPQSVTLTGTATAPPPTITPPSLTFAAQLVGTTTSTAQTVTLANTSDYPITIHSVTASTGFAVSSACGVAIGPNSSCQLSVTFAPTVTGSLPGSVTIASNATGSPQTIGLSGTATLPPPTVTVAPASLTFATAPTGSTSVAQPVLLSNTGGSTLNISSIAASGDFAETNNCGSALAVAGNCTVSVTFTPTAGGARTGTLTIMDNAPGSPQTVTLNGTGETVGVSSASSSLTVSGSGTVTDTIAVAPQSGFSGTVSLSCAINYLGSGTASRPPTCSLNPSSATIAGGVSGTTTLTVSTSGTATASSAPALGGAGLTLAGVLLLGLARRRRKFAAWCCGLLVLFVALGSVAGCGNSSPQATSGSYNVVVTATSGTVTVSTTIPLTIQ
jgi:hypothetical protein